MDGVEEDIRALDADLLDRSPQARPVHMTCFDLEPVFALMHSMAVCTAFLNRGAAKSVTLQTIDSWYGGWTRLARALNQHLRSLVMHGQETPTALAQVLFELRRCQFCCLAQQGRKQEALQQSRTRLTPLAEGSAPRQAAVRAAMLSLLPGKAADSCLAAAGAALQEALRDALGFEVRAERLSALANTWPSCPDHHPACEVQAADTICSAMHRPGLSRTGCAHMRDADQTVLTRPNLQSTRNANLILANLCSLSNLQPMGEAGT